jgi:hypothetical protein
MKPLFFFFTFIGYIAAFAQNNATVAVLDFENKALLKDATMQRVAGKVREALSAAHGCVALDRWLIDTMMAAQGNKQLLKCTDESCLFAIGHLLSVDLVVTGSITKQEKRYCVSAELVDIKNNIVAGYAQTFTTNFHDTAMARVSTQLVHIFLELANTKKPVVSTVAGAQPRIQKQNVLNSAANDSGRGAGGHDKPDGHKKKPGISELFVWVPVAAVVLGGAAAGIYFLGMKHAPANPPDNTISLDDAPKHPTNGIGKAVP